MLSSLDTNVFNHTAISNITSRIIVRAQAYWRRSPREQDWELTSEDEALVV